MTDHAADFLDHMRAVGVPPADDLSPIADDKVHRFRVDGDKPRSKNGAYKLRAEPDGFAFGWVMTHKEGVTHAWHAKTKRGAPKEDKAERDRRIKAAKAERAALDKATHAAAAKRTAGLWRKAAREGTTAYLDRKGITLAGAARISRDLVVVPLCGESDGPGSKPIVRGLQYIAADGSKRFLTGSEIIGSYCPIAVAGEAEARIIICEGFATGCTLRMAFPGVAIIVAFNAGNLRPVAEVMRRRYPDAVISIAADNDQWTTRQDGTPYNSGVEHAMQAAVAIGGARVVYPQVPEDDPDRRTDWNDMGAAAAAAAFAEREAEPTPEPEQPTPLDGPPLDADWPFRVLGHNGGAYFFLPNGGGQMVAYSPAGLASTPNLYALATRDWWVDRFCGGDEKAVRGMGDRAASVLIDMAHKVGIFGTDRVRGVGVWTDKGGAPIVHCGHELWRGGETLRPQQMAGAHIYEAAAKTMIVAQQAATDADAARFLAICHSLCWERDVSADLFAGWIVVAPICGALRWRPHIWVTGEMNSGKSTVMRDIMIPMIGAIGIVAEGASTTEASLRHELKSSARPIILDEAESENSRDRASMDAILGLARIASSGGTVRKGSADQKGALSFTIRSCFAFGGINPNVRQRADESRISQLVLKRDRRPDRDKRFERLKREMIEHITPAMAAAMLRRTIDHLPTLLANVETFSDAASLVLGDRRAADQVGAMLAGAHFLRGAPRRVTLDEAVKMVRESDGWGEYTAIDEDGDAERLVSFISTRQEAITGPNGRREYTVGQLIALALGIGTPDDRGCEISAARLGVIGIKARDGRVVFANHSPKLSHHLRDTPWTRWKRTLLEIPGAEREGPQYFGPGITQRAVSIPAEVLGLHAREVELPVDMGDYR